MDFVFPILLFLILLLSAWAGRAVRRGLHERHTSEDSVASIRLLMGMLLTFSAIVLGLLTSNAKERFDDYNNDLSIFAGDLIELDHRLRVYGSEADGIRRLVRSYTAAAIADSWPTEEIPKGDYPRFSSDKPVKGVERQDLGALLSSVDVEIEKLAPQTEFQKQNAARLRERVAETMQQRWRLILSTRSNISWPFLIVLTSWLAIIFAIFGLTSPTNGLVYIVVALSALSIASPLYLILDYSDAVTGLVQLSSEPLRAALAHMDAPS